MRRCLKVLNLLIEKKVAEVKGDQLRVWEYQGMIKRHVEKCPSCRKFLEGISEKSKISDAETSRIPIGTSSWPNSSCKGSQKRPLDPSGTPHF